MPSLNIQDYRSYLVLIGKVWGKIQSLMHHNAKKEKEKNSTNKCKIYEQQQ